MISQHNGGTPSYEQLWASPDEARKLDIYYREAVGDLERHLTEWILQTSAQFNLTQEGANYSLTLIMSPYWPVSMQGLLANKIQDYLVHAVTAGWLNDFEGLTVKQDYQAMSRQDIIDIRGIICLRAFGFSESERGDDGATKDDAATPTSSERNGDGKTKDDSEVPASSERGSDSTKKDDSAVPTPSERGDDGATKDDAATPTSSERNGDGKTKEGSGALTPGARQADVEKEQPLLRPEAGYRRNNNVIRSNRETVSCIDNLRHRDNDIVEHHSDYTDWSGTGMDSHAVQLCHDAHRVQKGRGFTPSPFDRCHKKPAPRPPIPPKPHHKDPRIPDFPTHPNYPPIVANGKGWSDEPLYDAEGSEHYVNDHVSPINTNNYE